MPTYYVNRNAQPTGEHEVHQERCPTPASPSNQQTLGYFTGCREAVVAARKHYANVDGCANCCPECHKR